MPICFDVFLYLTFALIPPTPISKTVSKGSEGDTFKKFPKVSPWGCHQARGSALTIFTPAISSDLNLLPLSKSLYPGTPPTHISIFCRIFLRYHIIINMVWLPSPASRRGV